MAQSGHISSAGLSGLSGINKNHLRANLVKMFGDDLAGKQPFNAHGVELNANWYKRNAPNHAVTKFSQQYGYNGAVLLHEYKKMFPSVFIEYGFMAAPEPKPQPQPTPKPAPAPKPQPAPKPKPQPQPDSPGGSTGGGSNSGNPSTGSGGNSGGSGKQTMQPAQPKQAGSSKAGLIVLGLAAAGTAWWYFTGDDKKKKKK